MLMIAEPDDGYVAHQVSARRAPSCSIETLRDRFVYEPDTGLLRWAKTVGARTKAGQVAGWVNDQGYLKVKVGTTPYYVARGIWAFVYGYWPGRLVDHKNGVVTDNRLSNLRLATNKENARNKTKIRAGLKGATWSIAANSWAAQIRLDGKNVHLGLFNTEEEAHLAYCEAAVELYGKFARFE